ncbi:MAG TPA: excinuclease ABC subunit UvrA [Candidatus Stercoripulliclostridium merdipullorum]|uniref:UvrABC system protein A n=1 Tax=Candidatus Stercoripulliclostridium merdipullorum TaxID=2840952 RepID=A0A9D1NBC2_9FIRM|nr:excinuclease ABC subunit UvrA [Candidatus Stercoripulliclostridium merdipullorum]
MKDRIVIKGAKVHNLKNLDVTIPRDKLVVFTGLSGSGKSSLAFDTLFAEGQRRYIESLSSYARQFLGQMDKPNVESIDGLSPAIAIDQKTTSKNPRSTVGTVTEIYDYFRLLFANIGIPHCPICGKEVRRISVDQITEKIMAYPAGSKILLLAPIVRGRKGEYVKQLESLKKSGYLRVKIDGIVYTLDEEINLDKNVKHTISVVVDRLVVKEGMSRRLTDSVEAALKLADGLVAVDCEGEETLFSTRYACPDCDVSMPELTPRMFSFNAPYGACPNCMGLGFRSEVDPDKVVKYPELSLRAGAIRVSGWMLMDFGKMAEMQFRALSEKYGFSLDTPWKDLPERIRHIILYGTGGETLSLRWESKRMSAQYESRFEGIVNNLNRRYNETQSDAVKADIERLMTSYPCEVCHGKRLKKEVLAVTVGGKNIAELSEMPVVDLAAFMANLSLNRREATIAEPIVKEIRERLRFLVDVGLGYLTLSRSAGTLSGGESQRIRLATQIGSGLTGVLYILDEPSIGLHQRDNRKLLNTLLRLRDLGNTLIVVEHDDETIRAADHIVDIGPGAGVNGGYLVAEGTVEEIMACPDSLTGDYLAGRKSVPLPDRRRPQDGRFLTVRGARQNNLKGIDVSFPVGLMTAVTGVSGSGKSSLVNGIVSPALANRLNNATQTKGKYDAIEGSEYFDKIINIDQSPIGRTPRSNPATYTGVFTPIRELFAMTQDAKARGYKAGRFSFNVAGGRCENCSGDGIIKIEMHFLPDVYVPCEVCDGKRYNHETLEVRYKGKNIYDVLEMTVDDACVFFENVPQIYSKIKCLKDVGLGYIKLGQPSTTLSGGEAQRVKLATELSKRSTGKTLYILDEPTTGLHVHDVAKLIAILQRLTDGGNTVIVIEHNLDVVKVADYIVDLGPEGGDGGGTLVAAGTPEEVAACEQSFTGAYLKPLLEG